MPSTFVIYYLETNLICFLFVSFVFYTYTKDSFGLTEAKWFMSALVTVQVYCIVDILAAIFKNKTFTGARAILWVSNIIYTTIPLILIIFWNFYITEHTRNYYYPGKYFKLLDKIIPSISVIMCVVSFSTPLTHSTFYLDNLNVYHRTIGT